MKLFFDTSILVEIDRHHEHTIEFLKRCTLQGHELCISTITVAEILTGTFLRRDSAIASLIAKEVLNQFSWYDVSGTVAEHAAKISAHLYVNKMQDSVENQDILIAATAINSGADALITLNKKDFVIIPNSRSFSARRV